MLRNDLNLMCPHCGERERASAKGHLNKRYSSCGNETCVALATKRGRNYGYTPFPCPICTREVTLEMQDERGGRVDYLKSCNDPECIHAIRTGQRGGMTKAWLVLMEHGPMNAKDLVGFVSGDKSQYTPISLSQKIRFVPHIRTAGKEIVRDENRISPPGQEMSSSDGAYQRVAMRYDATLYEAVPIEEIKSETRLPPMLKTMRRKRNGLRQTDAPHRDA